MRSMLHCRQGGTLGGLGPGQDASQHEPRQPWTLIHVCTSDVLQLAVTGHQQWLCLALPDSDRVTPKVYSADAHAIGPAAIIERACCLQAVVIRAIVSCT